MNKTRKAIALALSFTLVGVSAISASAETQWERNHPRRDQVNDRLANQNRRINQEVREGEISRSQARQLHREDRAIRGEERMMAKFNNGHITPAEQRALNQQENAVSRQFEDPRPGPDDLAQLQERTDLLQKAILTLPDYQRIMVVMYHTEGQSYEEIASTLDLPIGTVKSRLNRARLALREALQPVQEHFQL